ncbi:MAG: MBOAT family O-acyltransferase, partial [Polyangiaceae bacterium]
RWHISLSTWLRDYLYIPLGGSRKGSFFTYRNLMITMVLGGLWHGASWNFVIWGTLHGGALAVTRMWQRRRGAASTQGGSPVGRALATLATFHFVCLAWIFFRAPTLAHATLAITQIARGGWGLEHIAPKVVPVIAIAMGLHFVPREWESRAREVFVSTPAVVQGLVLAGAALALHLAASAKPEPFLYGQF